MKRCVYWAKLKPDMKEVFSDLTSDLEEKLKQYILDQKLMTLSIFDWKGNLFLYYECISEIIKPEQLVGDLSICLESWPGIDEARYWVPMMDIFHYNKPVSTEHWSRKEPVQKRVARIARLKDEMYSSYIFYHFQLQEEKPSIVGNKYGIIAVHEDLMFFYHEEPGAVENPSLYDGKLKTQNTPADWSGLMNPHFIFWEDGEKGQEIWKYINVVFEI